MSNCFCAFFAACFEKLTRREHFNFLVESNLTEVLPSGCEASSTHSTHVCLNDLDLKVGTDWATIGQGTGSWIKV